MKVTREELGQLIVDRRWEEVENADVGEITDMSDMFYGSDFSGDISGWNVSNVTDMSIMFSHCPLESTLPLWYRYGG